MIHESDALNSISNRLNNLRPDAEKDPKSVAAKVQGMFTEVMLKAMEDSVGAEDGLFGGSSSSDIYRGMFREQLAAAIGAQLKSPLQQQIEGSMQKGEQGHSHESGEHETAQHGLPVSGVVTSEVGWRKDPLNGILKFHKGTDIAAPAGTPIQAVAGGTVVESGPKGTYGNAVVIQTDDGRRMLYAHNQQNFVQVGDRVAKGDSIAAVGSTGRSTGAHVHFEVTS